MPCPGLDRLRLHVPVCAEAIRTLQECHLAAVLDLFATRPVIVLQRGASVAPPSALQLIELRWWLKECAWQGTRRTLADMPLPWLFSTRLGTYLSGQNHDHADMCPRGQDTCLTHPKHASTGRTQGSREIAAQPCGLWCLTAKETLVNAPSRRL